MATEVLVPPLGQTIDTATLVEWYKQEGEIVEEGEMLFVIETDKATMDVEAPATGVLRRITAQPGDEVQVLSAIALVAAPDEVLEDARPSPDPEAVTRTTSAPVSNQVLVGEKGNGRGDRIFISPRARRLTEKHQIALAELNATGPEESIVERDVRAYLAAHPAPTITPVARRMAEEADLEWRTLTGSGPGGRITRDDVSRSLTMTPSGDEEPEREEEQETLETIPLSGVRAIISERMAQSAATTAPVTLTAEVDATALVQLRQRLIQDGIQASYNDLFLYTLARALRDHPRLNASIEGEVIKVWRLINIGLAVDTDRGLLVPVVRDVAGRGLQELAEATQSLIQRTQAGQIAPDELRGGTFTLTNLGMFGIDAFTPIINLPECAVLGVGRIKTRPVMIDDDKVVGRQMVWLSLTFDHRLVDGGPAARFLQRVVQLVERPHLLLA